MPSTPPAPRMADIQAVPRATSLGVELVADDPEREREDRAAEALQRARGDHHRERGRQRGDDDAGRERTRASRAGSARRPYMSPSRPASGVATAAASRKAVKIQAAPVCEVCRRSCSVGSAGIDERLHERVAAARQHQHGEQRPRAPAGRRTDARLPHVRSSGTVAATAAVDGGSIVSDLLLRKSRSPGRSDTADVVVFPAMKITGVRTFVVGNPTPGLRRPLLHLPQARDRRRHRGARRGLRRDRLAAPRRRA